MRILITTILLLVFALSIFAQEMKVHLPKLKLTKQDGNNISHENSISPQKAANYYKQLKNQNVLSPEFYKVPDNEDYFIVAASVRVNNFSYPNKLFLFKESQGVLVEQFRSRNFVDRIDFKPIFFVGEKSALIFAEKWYAGFDGIESFEFKDNQMTYLGNLNLASRVGSSNFYYNANPLKYYYNAKKSEQAKVYFQNDSYKIELKGEFYKDFESSGGKKISSKDSKVIYKLDKMGFQLMEVKTDSGTLKNNLIEN